jgi:plasmid stabilization system protein ParE
MKLTWTARARTRLAELHDYIEQDSKTRALAMVERILDRADTLLVAPLSGLRLKTFVEDEVRELFERPYRIIYRVSATPRHRDSDRQALPPAFGRSPGGFLSKGFQGLNDQVRYCFGSSP